jgi:hypothetical protein
MESMGRALEDRDRQIDVLPSECKILTRTKGQRLQRVGRLQADITFLERGIAQLEDGARGLCPTWQFLRLEQNILARQNILLRKLARK